MKIAFLSALIVLAWQTAQADLKGCGMNVISVSSVALASMQAIPPKYTCNGENVSPPLSWKGIPERSKSIVLICDDPDAPGGTWVHWVCYDIPASVDSLDEGIPSGPTLSCGGKQGSNDFHFTGYGAPCPPSGTHRYFFKVYCLDVVLNLPAGKSKRDIERAMDGHVLATGVLVGTYTQKR